MAPEMRDNDVPIFHLLSQTANWHLRPDFFYRVFFAKAPYWLSYRQVPFQRLLFGSALYKNSDFSVSKTGSYKHLCKYTISINCTPHS